MYSSLRERQEHLSKTNVRWLRELAALLDRINDAAYVATPSGLAPHKAGSHVRHVLEFYECFLGGLPGSHIDYDVRKRDLSVERTRKAAQERIRSIMDRLECEPLLRTDSVVWVRVEDSAGSEIPEPFMISSIGRELQALSSHTIHHFALIAIVLRSLGIPVDSEFGMAPSTLRYLAARGEAEAA
jgi:hypothetical protein